MNKLNIYKYLVIILIGFIFIFLLVLGFFSKSKVTPTPIPEGPQPGATYSYSNDQDVQYRDQSYLVGQLIKKLPHQGQYFKLEYSFSDNNFTLTLKKGQDSQGNAEFDNFLKTNQILSRDWLQNLQINVK